MIKNILVPFLVMSLIFMPVIAHAQEAPPPAAEEAKPDKLDLRMTFILKDAPAPFTGYLLTLDSAASIQGQLRLTEQRLNLQIDFLSQKSLLELGTQKQLFETRLSLLDTQLQDSRRYNTELEDKIIKMNSGFDWTPVIFVAGIVVGGLVVMGTVSVTAEVFK